HQPGVLLPMSTHLVWLRHDLRLTDNPALAAASADGGAVIALYIHETDAEVRQPGGAARWWLHHSLERLGVALAGLGIPLRVETGAAGEVIGRVVADSGATH